MTCCRSMIFGIRRITFQTLRSISKGARMDNLDKSQAEELKDQLEEMVQSRPYRVLLQRIEDLLHRDQRLLESAREFSNCLQLQGQIVARRADINMAHQLCDELRHQLDGSAFKAQMSPCTATARIKCFCACSRSCRAFAVPW